MITPLSLKLLSYSKPTKFSKYIFWIFKRHPYLYFTRFRLVSKNVKERDILNEYYNITNPQKDIPKVFFDVNQQVFQSQKDSTDLEKTQNLSIWLVNHIKGGRGLSMSSEKAIETMLAGEGGVCSDMAQIFNNFCVVNNLKVREWGVTLIPFNTDYGGHSFNEVYCMELDKWVFVDVSNCLLFYSNTNEMPLSVMELYNLVREDKLPKPYFFNKVRTFKKKILDDYYFNKQAAPFLICNYSTKTYDEFLERFRPLVPVFVIHFLIFALGKGYRYKFPLNNYRGLFA